MSQPVRRSLARALCAILCLAGAAACGGDSPTGGGGGGTGGNGGGGTVVPSPGTIQASGTVPASAAVGATLDVGVVVMDQKGAPLAGANVQWQAVSGGGSFEASTSTTDAQGQARARWKLGTATGENRATASVPTVNPVSFTTAATAGPVAKVQLSADALGLEAGQTQALTVSATDQFGNAVTAPAPQSPPPPR